MKIKMEITKRSFILSRNILEGISSVYDYGFRKTNYKQYRAFIRKQRIIVKLNRELEIIQGKMGMTYHYKNDNDWYSTWL